MGEREEINMGRPLNKRQIPGSESETILKQAGLFEPPCSADQLPIVWDKAKGTRVWDVDGNEYLDFTSGVLVTNVGHCHPVMIARIQEQITRLDNSYSFRTPQRVAAAQRIVESTPDNLNQVFMLTTGSDATEAAMRLARLYTGKQEILSFYGGFHGKTYGALSVAGSKGTKGGFGTGVPGTIFAPYPYCYRCFYDKQYPDCDLYCLKALDRILEAESWGDLGSVIIEPYQGAAGFIFPPEGYLKALEGWANERDLVLIIDEVQSSFGRTGKMYMVEWEDIHPQLLTLGKGMGSSLPASAVVGEEKIFARVGKSGLSSTWGGNPLSSAAVLAVFEIIEKDNLLENCQVVGKILLEGLNDLKEKYEILGDVRGRGLVYGLEFVKEDKQPAPDLTYDVIYAAAQNGLMLGKLGLYGNVIRIAPPLCITEEEVVLALRILDNAIGLISG
jgi:4-aminobutyrate aminotransferase-like enzyme